jgi:hypothetical protein
MSIIYSNLNLHQEKVMLELGAYFSMYFFSLFHMLLFVIIFPLRGTKLMERFDISIWICHEYHHVARDVTCFYLYHCKSLIRITYWIYTILLYHG